MKRIRTATLLTVLVGVLAYPGITIYAASNGTPAYVTPGDAKQSPDTHVADTVGPLAYANHCAICHGEQREGILPAFPPVLDITRRMTDQQLTDLIHSGKGRMPAFPKLQNEELAALLRYLATSDISTTASHSGTGTDSTGAHSGLIDTGGLLFQRSCAFCHGRDAEGGETGPDLTRSKLVLADVGGDKISEVVRDGRPEKKMPGFNFSSQEMLSLAAFIHEQQTLAASHKGGRRGVDIADLQTGNVEAGKQYFNSTGTCATCHSATGDLAGIASKYEGLQLEERMLYPRDVNSRVTVTLSTGQKVQGTLAYLDEFTVGLRDANGSYRSWTTSRVKYSVDSPVNAHVELFSKYTDADIHNLMAYLQTLR